MKLKRAKQYRKLMHQYELQFSFREPYQVLLDAQILEDAFRFKIDLIPRLESVLQGKVKPMLTQCSIRHLYNAKPKNDALIEQAKGLERRRCNHHTLEDPLSSLECLSEVVDPKDNLTNKHRYIVASQDPEVRAHMRRIAGVPLLYINKSVMIMEPMAEIGKEQRDSLERGKLRAGLKGQRTTNAGQKRKRDTDAEQEQNGESIEGQSTGDARPQKKNKRKGPKEPNPLSMKKSKKAEAPAAGAGAMSRPKPAESTQAPPSITDAAEGAVPDGESGHRKRKRRHKPKGEDNQTTQVDVGAGA